MRRLKNPDQDDNDFKFVKKDAFTILYWLVGYTAICTVITIWSA